jgi:hypothetical protein
MRRLTSSIIIAAIALSSLTAQELDKILDDHFQAYGQEKMSTINTITSKGKNSLVAFGLETPLTLYRLRPNNFRLEADFAGSKIIQTFDGKTGWTYAPLLGITEPQQLGSAELKSFMQQAQMDSPLWNYKAKGYQIDLAGSSPDGSANMLKVVTPAGEEMTIYLDKKSSLISLIRMNVVSGGAQTEMEVEFKDYKLTDGIPMAHYIGMKMNGQTVNEATFDTFEFNQPLDPLLFKKPVTR